MPVSDRPPAPLPPLAPLLRAACASLLCLGVTVSAEAQEPTPPPPEGPSLEPVEPWRDAAGPGDSVELRYAPLLPEAGKPPRSVSRLTFGVSGIVLGASMAVGLGVALRRRDVRCAPAELFCDLGPSMGLAFGTFVGIGLAVLGIVYTLLGRADRRREQAMARVARLLLPPASG